MSASARVRKLVVQASDTAVPFFPSHFDAKEALSAANNKQTKSHDTSNSNTNTPKTQASGCLFSLLSFIFCLFGWLAAYI